MGLLLAAMAIVAVSGVIFGMTGFGFALISVPPLLLLYEPTTVVALMICITIATSGIVMVSGRSELDWRLVFALFPGALLGLAIGTRILQDVDPVALKIVAGTFVAIYSVALLAGFQPVGGRNPIAIFAASLTSGALATSTGLSGPPIVMLLSARQMAKDAFRSTITTYFVVIAIASLPLLLASGAVGQSEIVTSLWLSPAAMVGTFVGNRLVRKMNAAAFRKLTLVLLLVTGLMGIITAAVALL